MQRPISARAYATYARARLLERTGDVVGAADAYEDVLALDSGADEAWFRLGAIHCIADPERAKRDFAKAKALRPDSASRSLTEARCYLARGDLAEAESSAEIAVRLAPFDPEPSRELTRVFLARGKRPEALRYAWAHVAVFPRDHAGWSILGQLVTSPASHQAQLEHRAARFAPPSALRLSVVAEGPPGSASRRHTSGVPARIDLEHGLATGDHQLVQRAARELRIGTVPLMALAVELGALEFAKQLADLAGRIQPENATIWLRRLDLADRLRDDAGFEALLHDPPDPFQLVAPADTQLLFDLIARRVGANVPPAIP